MKYKTLFFFILIVNSFFSCINSQEEKYDNSFDLKFKKNKLKLKITSFNETSEIESSFLEITKTKVFNKKLNDSIEIPFSIENESIPNNEITIFNTFDLDLNQSKNGEIYSSGFLHICVAGHKCKLNDNNYSDKIIDEKLKSFNNYQIISLQLNPKVSIQGQYREILLKTKINYDITGKIIESISFRNIKTDYNLDINKRIKLGEYYLPNSDSNQLIKLKIVQVN